MKTDKIFPAAFTLTRNLFFVADFPTFNRVKVAFRAFDAIHAELNKFNGCAGFLCFDYRFFKLVNSF
jgi:hypothetical protein